MNFYNMEGDKISLEEWAEKFEDNSVALNEAVITRGKWWKPWKTFEVCNVRVSTVLLGFDHNFSQEGRPLIFETMIFGGPHDQYQERYATLAEAVEGHKKACKLAGVK